MVEFISPIKPMRAVSTEVVQSEDPPAATQPPAAPRSRCHASTDLAPRRKNPPLTIAPPLVVPLAGVAVAYEQQVACEREEGEMLQAFLELRDAQLTELVMLGVDIDYDGIRDGGLV